MKTLLKIAFAAAVATALAKAFLRQMSERRDDQAGKNLDSSAEYAVPTLHAVTDAEPRKGEPLDEGDLNVAQNAPL